MRIEVPRPWLKRLLALACVAVLMAAVYAPMCASVGVSPAEYKFTSYLLQAQAWLRGETALDRNYTHLELALYEGRYYVSFPPVPSVPMLIYTLIWGDDVPNGLILKLYLLLACMLMLSQLMREKRLPWNECAAWAFLLCFACAMTPISLVAGVWYEAQVLAFLFVTAAVVALRRGRPTLACLMYALAVGCRPFCACFGAALAALYVADAKSRGLTPKAAARRLLPGLIVGLAIAAAYGWYNYIRFGNPLEFGHNYLPEFVESEHGQFSIAYLGKNFRELILGAPYALGEDGTLSVNRFGFSMFISCPIFICQLIWLIRDAVRRALTPLKLILFGTLCLNTFLLMLHKTIGGLQFGARYCVEMIPLCFAYLLASPDRGALRRWEAALLSLGLVINVVGGCMVHI